MDTVWVDTMFPGIDPDEGWEKNLERVVNYDYLLKEYLDWQLKHLTVDNMDPVDWARVEADIISMAAQSVDLTAYYTKDEADNKSQLLLQAAEDYTQAQLASYYTASEVDSAISTQAGLTLTAAEGYVDTQLLSYYTANQVDGAISAQATLSQQAAENYVNTTLQSYYTASQVDGAISAQAVLSQQAAEGYTDTQLGSYYTKTEIGDFTGYQTAVAALQAYADAAVANIDLSAYYTSSEVDSAISTQAGLTLAAAEAAATAELSAKVGNIGSSTVKAYTDGLISGLSLAATGSGSSAKLVLQSGGSTIANSGASMALSVTNNSNGYSTLALTAGGITLATSGQINLGGNVIFAGDNISYLTNNSGYQTRSGVVSIIDGTVDADFVNALGITAKAIRATGSAGAYVYGSTSGSSNYLLVHADGFDMYTGGTLRATLYEDSSEVTLRLGNNNYAYVQKYYEGSTHYMWIGSGSRTSGVGIRFDLTNKRYHIYGTAE